MTERKRKILVVDDEPDIVRMIRARLEAHNYDVAEAFDGMEALTKVESERPDLILLDILMPRMDGSTFLHEMKLRGWIGKIPVIVLTAKASMKEFFLVHEVANFMVKPFNSRDLLAEIAKHVSPSPAAEETRG